MKLRTIHPQIFEKIKTSQPEPKFTGSYKKERSFHFVVFLMTERSATATDNTIYICVIITVTVAAVIFPAPDSMDVLHRHALVSESIRKL